MRRSPKLNDAKVDASDMLQQGVLRSFMERILKTTAPTPSMLRRLIRDALAATSSMFVIPGDLVSFDDDTPAPELARIAQQLQAIITHHERRQAA